MEALQLNLGSAEVRRLRNHWCAGHRHARPFLSHDNIADEIDPRVVLFFRHSDLHLSHEVFNEPYPRTFRCFFRTISVHISEFKANVKQGRKFFEIGDDNEDTAAGINIRGIHTPSSKRHDDPGTGGQSIEESNKNNTNSVVGLDAHNKLEERRDKHFQEKGTFQRKIERVTSKRGAWQRRDRYGT